MKNFYLLSFIFIIVLNLSVTAQEDFTIILLPDTQNDAQFFPSIFTSQTQWIVNNKTTQNIVFVTHLGDIVNSAGSAAQYNNADAAMDLLDEGNVAYSVGPGNHDMGTGSLYETYFGVSRFSGKSWYGGSYGGNNYNSYSLFSASGMDFILINLQYQWTPDAAILEWADALLKAFPNRRGIVESHNILKIDDTWSNDGIYLTLKDNPNLFLMVCGHNYTITDGSAYRSELGDDGHTIHIMLADYQAFSWLGNGGYLRILRFSPLNDKIYATTYSPYKNRYMISYPDQMEMTYDMISGDEGILVETKVFLEGPYDSGTHAMTTTLKSQGFIPTTSPYAEDPRTAVVPANVTDWVLVQLRSTYDGSAIASKSVFLHKEGRIVADDGINSEIEISASPGNYYIVLKHRNHLAVMSSSAVTFISPPAFVSYDFTRSGANSGDQFWGEGAAAKELESSIWGMIAGDANSNEQIQNNDSENYWKPENGTGGYKNSDYNLNGQVQNNDNENYWKPNNGRGSQVP